MFNFTLGADPELFVKNIHTDEFVSAHDLIPGTKENPYVVPGGAIQVDGTALEFNINPASSLEEWMKNLFLVQDNLSDRIERTPFTDHYISVEPTAFYNKEYFDALPDHARLMGCMPDFNAYTGEENTPPETEEPFRTAGGHVHVGWGEYLDPNDPDHFELCRSVVKQLDSVLFDASMIWDPDDKRRELYGNKGAFRPKSYGVEYRPLSCAWLGSDQTKKFIYEQSIRAMDLLFNKGIKLYD